MTLTGPSPSLQLPWKQLSQLRVLKLVSIHLPSRVNPLAAVTH